MKNTFTTVILCLLLSSCTKNIEQKQEKKEKVSQSDYLKTLYFGVSDMPQQKGGWFPAMWFNDRVGRISMWMMNAQDNYGSSRVDYIEFLVSDHFMNDVDADDLVKIGADQQAGTGLAIKNTHYLLWKEQRFYPWSSDTIKLKSWNYKTDNYFFKIAGSNFPSYIKVKLKDKFTNTYTDLNVYDNYATTWYPFNVASTDVNFGIKSNDTHRFEIVIVSEY